MAEWINGTNIAVILFFIGLAGLIVRKNMVMSVIALGIMNAGIILAFVTMNSSMSHEPPMIASSVATAADPVPQALMITSVVIGVAVNAVMLVLILDIYRQKATLDWQKAKLISEGRGDQRVPIGFAAPLLEWRQIVQWLVHSHRTP
ncbi:MAG: cation:proton antiporter subunit C [Cellulomonadaceae bacterium]|jgi:multicomponent Na+:H+ antiporter subunit C|nr:cation:proton antiporter subunit C [Cellulomonadaceae bacterium]